MSAPFTSEKFVVFVSKEITYSFQVLANFGYAFQFYHQISVWLANGIFKRHD